MLTDLFNAIDNYAQLHPLRFGFILIACLTVFLALILLSKRFWVKLADRIYRKKSYSNTNEALETKSTISNHGLTRIQKLLPVVVLGGLALLVSGLIYFKNTPNIAIRENLNLTRSSYLFGIDVSHYQGKIRWEMVRTSNHPINYVIIRATMGKDGVDSRFRENWQGAKNQGYPVGAYHYYRPHENSTEQFQNFKSIVHLEPGDLLPVLDIEELSRHGIENLRQGILNWLQLAESHYGRKPIVYTGRSFYNDYLRGHIEDYPLWIADYTGKHYLHNINWTMHQFTDKVRVRGILTEVDGNDFRGDINKLNGIKL